MSEIDPETWEDLVVPDGGAFRGMPGKRCKLCGSEYAGYYAHPHFLREHEAVCFGRAFNGHKEQNDVEQDKNAFSELWDRETAAALEHAKAQDAAAATGLFCPTPDEIARARQMLDPSTASIETANRERADLQRTFDLIMDSDRRAISMWREAARTDEERAEREAIIPDRANLVTWCLQRLDAVTAECDREHRRVVDLEAKLADDGEDAAPRVRTQIHRINVPDPDAFIRGIQRHEKAEIDTLRARVSELMRQRDIAEGRFRTANHHHGETSAALAAMTIKWLKLENETRERINEALETARDNPPPVDRRDGDLAVARIKNRKLECRIADLEEKCWKAIEIVSPESGLPFFRERIVDVESAVETMIVGLVKEVNSRSECIARMSDLCAAAQKWAASDERQTSFGYMVDEKLTEAVKAYEDARSQAANADEEIPADEYPAF